MVKHLTNIAAKEGVQAEPEALNVIAQKADGAMRDALSIFDQAVAFCGNNLTYANVIENLNVLDYEYYFKLTDHFANHRYADALLLFDEVLAKGFDAQHFIAGLSTHFRDLLMCKDARTLMLLEVGDAVVKRYEAQAAPLSYAFLYEALQLTNACEVGYKLSGNPRLHVELSLLRLSNIGVEKKNDSAELTEKAADVVENTPPPASHSIHISKSPPAYIPQESRIFSLKNALSKETEETKKVAMQMSMPEEKNNPLTQEQLADAWTALISHVADKQRLTTVLQDASPVLKADNVISFSVWNKLQKEWIEKNEAILDFLCNKLQNNSVRLEVTIHAEDVKNTAPYTHDEKFRFLGEQYPLVAQLKQIMKLDIR
jgi:DNA polymerase-3 subunit gamma/tau